MANFNIVSVKVSTFLKIFFIKVLNEVMKNFSGL